MNVNYIKEHAILVSIIIFLLIFGSIQMIKPAFLYNKDGSIRVVGFNRTNTDLNLGQRNRSGVSLSFRKDYDKFGDLFKKKKR